MTDQQIPGFEILEKLGQGGMAAVYKARQISLDRIVAIKVLSSHLSHDPADIERFRLEAQQAAKLKHPGIVQVYDAHIGGKFSYFVMEYVAGYTVGDWLRRKGLLPEKDVLLVAECVADALDYAWQTAGMIHCDIKPDNIIVDADGTVKVADLGLARTINAMSVSRESDEVMGTPAYMSPEQAMGLPDLDCRADIYSLGAMLYHLSTGRLMFEGEPEDKVMELQVNGTVPDPIDLNPNLSRPFCWMLEKMLAKKRELRYADWTAVRADLLRVKKGMPLLQPLPEGSSTVSRSTKRLKAVVQKPAAAEANGGVERSGLSLATKVAVCAGIVVVLIWGIKEMLQPEVSHPTLPPPPKTAPPAPVPTSGAQPAARQTPAVAPDQAAQELFDYAVKWAGEHPDDYDGAIEKFQKVSVQTRGTKYSLMADEKVRAIAEDRNRAIEKVLKDLEERTSGLVKDGRFLEAADIYEKYDGVLAAATLSRRKAAAGELRSRHAVALEEQRVQAEREKNALAAALDRIVNALVGEGVESALRVANEAMADAQIGAGRRQLSDIGHLLADTAALDQKILESFRPLIGQQITVQLNDASKTLVVSSVKDGKVYGEQKMEAGSASASVSVSFTVRDLAVRERLARMGSEQNPEVALSKGLLAMASKAYPQARKYFGLLDSPLKELLSARIDSAERSVLEDEARSSFNLIMKTAGVPVEGTPMETWPELAAKSKIPPDQAAKTAEMVTMFRQKYAGTDAAAKADAALTALMNALASAVGTKDVAVKPPPLPALLAGVKDNPAAWRDLMLRRNPELGPDELSLETASDGSVTRLSILSPGLQDIFAVAAFQDLREAVLGAARPDNYWRTEPISRLSDLGPLRGLPLQSLSLAQTSVKSLEPLRGMQLKSLRIRLCPVSDLSPLRDMKTLEELWVRGTDVKDLAPIRDLALRKLDIAETKVFDLRPVSSMPLEWLDISQTQVKDIGVLAGKPVSELNIAGTKLFNFTVLKNLPLRRLNCNGTQFRELGLLRGTTVRELDMGNTPISDISVLQDMPLTYLSIEGTPVKDFSVLATMPLRQLNLRATKIGSLNVLKNLPLEWLDISETQISDLSPLAGMSLKFIALNNTRVRDLSVLAGMPLRHASLLGIPPKCLEPLRKSSIRSIVVDDPTGEVRSILRAMPELEEVNWRRFRTD